MSVESISDVLSNTGVETTTETGSVLDKDAFMELLIVQMQNQDPMKPMDNAQMTAELAQLGQLEQLENLNSSFELFQRNTTSAVSLMNSGQEVELELSTGDLVTGTLDKIQWNSGETQYVIDGVTYSSSAVASLRPVVETVAETDAETETTES